MPGIEKIRGHLEKKKDWIRRTRDYRQKADKIRKLKRKAKERNPDEFNFHMVRSQVGLDGVHRDLEEDEEKTEVQQLLGDIGDINYVRFHLGKEKKKIEKLKFQLHASSTVGIDAAKLKDTEKEKLRLCAELGKRMEREKELEVVLKKLELKKDLALSKKSQLKPKLVRKGDAQKASVYKWTYERKK